MNHKSRMGVIVFDCKTADLERAASFWSDAIMEAPTGHRFCLVKPQDDAFDDAANNWSNG